MEKLFKGGPLVKAYSKAFNTWESRALRMRRHSNRRPPEADEMLVPFRDIDYVLVYEKDYEIQFINGGYVSTEPGEQSEDCELSLEQHRRSVFEAPLTKQRRHRRLFELAMKQEGLGFEEEVVGDYVFIKVHTPFDRLCQEAENVRLDLPLDGISLDDEPDLEDPDQTVDPQQWLQDKMAKLLDLGQRTRNISAPFQIKCKDWFIGPRDRETFFNSAIRGLLVC